MNTGVRVCLNCKNEFSIVPDDLSFYEKIGGVCSPVICPSCRAQLRLSFRNERVFYKRKCDKCGKDVVSMYSPNKPFTVWCYDCWFSDNWGGEDYAQDYNYDKPFFEQFKVLWEKVPKVSLIYMRSPGSEYTNISADNSNCYMIIESSNNENSINSYWIQECRDVTDTSFSSKCELTYESDDCYNSYKLLYSKGCHDCATSYFLTDCKGCTDCIGCINLRNKSNHIFNISYTKDEFEKIKNELKLNTHSGIKNFVKQYQDFLNRQPIKFAEIVQAVNSTGSYLKNVNNCNSCFHCYDAENNKYGVHLIRNAKDVMDADTAGINTSLMYNSINSAINTNNVVSGAVCWTCSFVEYSMYCFNSNNCFGCVGLRKKNYCILNKQYEKSEYEKIVEKIKNELKEKGEYGNFFTKNLTCFGYNETPANEQFPLKKEEALAQGFKWEDTERGTYGKETKQIIDMPESFADIDFDATKEIYICLECNKNFKVVPNELLFYQKLDIPLPHLCPDCRHKRRVLSRGPNQLWHRSCMKPGCTNEFETSYAPELPAIIYCEKCYQQEVY